MSDKLVVEIDSKDAEVAMRNLDRLTTAAEQMGKAFENTKGATSALRELRLMLTGIKGQGSSLDELKNSIQSLNSTADSLKRSFAGSVGQLGRIFKNEMAELKSIVQETGLGIGKAAADSLSDGIASPESRRKVAGAMRAQVAEMQAAYEQELAKGVKFSGRDLFDFKSWGLNIGADAKQAIRDGLVKDAAPIPVEKILGLDKSQVVKSAKDSAAVFQEAYSVEMAQGRLLFKNFERALGLDKSQVVKSAKDSAVVFREAYNAEMRSMQRSAMPIAKVSRVDAADATYASAMAQMKDYYKELESSTNSGVASAGKMSNAFKRLTIDGNDVHSMARGLASGFNLLWLTWGNLVPLFIGAAISNGFIQTAKTGMQVAHTLETIAILGGNTAEEMAALNIELDRIGNSGPFGPLAVAESMKVLSLAGLKANEILAVTQDVLNFSIAGTTDLKTAADALVSISTAFGMGAAGFGRVSDVVSKAAAESKTSVESFANAMKAASVINKQYGVSLEDTATGIAALSQLGIEGTAAGTALRNMYADLSGRSIQVSKVLKAQGIEMRDTVTGGFRPMLEVVAELNTKLQGLDAIGQKNLLQAILSERGAKGIVELLQLINTEAKNAGAGMSNALQQMRKSIEESYGFAAISAAKLSQTAESQFKSVKATLETSMNDAYKSVEPTLRLIADGLRKAFSSPEFIAGLSQMVTMTAQLALSFVELTRFIVEHQGAIAAAVAAYSLISLAIRHKAAAMVASTAATTADTAATLANNAAKAGAVGALGTLGRLIPGLGTAITLAAGAWMAYDFWQSKSKDTAAAASDLYNNNIIKNLNDEANRLRELNDLRAKGLTLSEAQQLLNDQNSREKGIAPASNAVVEAIRNEYSAVQKLNKARAEQAMQTTREGAHRVTAAENALAVAKKATSTAKAQEAKVINELADAQARVVQERKRDAGFLAAEAKKREELFKSGTKGFGLGAGNSAGNSAERRTYQDTKIAIDNRLAEIVKGYNKEKEEARNAASDEKAMLDSKHRNGLISEGEYQSQLFNTTKESEQKQLAQIKSSRDEYIAIYQGRIKELADQWLEAKSRPTKNEADRKAQQDDLNKIADAWENLGNTATTEIEKMDSDARQLASKGMRDLAIASDNAMGAIVKLKESERKYWAEDKATLDKAKALDAVNEKYRIINDSVFSLDEASRAYEVAAAESTAKHEAHIEELTNSLNVAELAAQAFWDGAVGRGGFDTGEFALWLKLKKVATDTGNAIADAKTKAGMSASAAGQIAFDRKRKEQNTKLASDLSDAVMTGLFDGAEAGKKKLRDVLVAELKRPITMVINLAMNAAVNGIMGSLGLGGAAGGGGIMGMASNASTAYNLITSGFNVASQAGKWLATSEWTSIGGEAVQEMLGQFGAGMMNTSSWSAATQAFQAGGAQMAGVIAGSVLNGFTGYGISSALSGGYSAGGWVNTAAGIASAIPVVGPITGVVGGVVNRAFGLKHDQTNLQGTFGGATGFEGQWEDYYKGGWFRSGKSEYKPLEEETRSALAGQFNAMRIATAAMAGVLGSGADAIADFTAKVNIKLKGLSPEEAEKAIQAEMDKVAEALAKAQLDAMGRALMVDYKPTDFKWGGYGSDNLTIGQLEKDIATWKQVLATGIREDGTAAGGSTIKWVRDAIAKGEAEIAKLSEEMWKPFAKSGETAVQTLTRLSSSLTSVNDAFSSLGNTLYAASLQGSDTASKLADLFGGVEGFNQATSSYFSNFYSPEDQRNDAQRRLELAFASVGQVLPNIDASDAREQFRAIVSDQDLTTESGRKTWATLIQVSEAFANLTPIVEGTSDAISEVMKRLQSDTANLQIDLLRAQGNTAGADIAQRLLDIKGLTEAEVAVYDYNAALRAQITTLEAMERLQSDTANLQIDLLRAQGNTAGADIAQRLLDIKGLTEAEIAIYDYNESLRSQITNLTSAKDALISAYSDEANKQLELVNAYEASTKSLEDFKRSLTFGNLSTESTKQKYEKSAVDYLTTYQKALTGDTAAISDFSNYATNFLELSRSMFSSGAEYTSDYERVKSDVDKILSISGAKKSEHQETLDAANKQIDYLSGIDSGVKTLAQAIDKFTTSLIATSESDSVSQVLQAYASVGRTGFGTEANQIDVGGFEYWLNNIKNQGLQGFEGRFDEGIKHYLANVDDKVAQYVKDFLGNGVPKFARGGMHSGGVRLVGERGPELEFTGPARYVDSGNTSRLLGGNNSEDFSRMSAQLAALTMKLAELQEKVVEAIVEGAILNSKATEENTEVVSKAVKETGSKREYTNNIKRKISTV